MIGIVTIASIQINVHRLLSLLMLLVDPHWIGGQMSGARRVVTEWKLLLRVFLLLLLI